MKIWMLLFLAAIIFAPIQSYAQVVGGGTTACESNVAKVTELIAPVVSNVGLQCATEKVVVIVFEETNSQWGWTAVELLAKANYTLTDVTTSGLGSEGNPTRFYAIMTK
jgi:hypothetical protein